MHSTRAALRTCHAVAEEVVHQHECPQVLQAQVGQDVAVPHLVLQALHERGARQHDTCSARGRIARALHVICCSARHLLLAQQVAAARTLLC